MKCVFFGSPEFAVASLEALLNSSHEVVGVITQPDRPAGRGLKLEAPEVKKLALTKGIPTFQPEKINTEATLDWLREKKPDQLVVVAYGEFLGAKLLQFCQRPPINVHPSLLPDLRGAAPMQWALLRGYKKTGVSTQFMVKEMDAGDLLLQTTAEIFPNETAGELQNRLKVIGGKLLVETLDMLAGKGIVPKPQNASLATLAPLLTKEQGKVDWAKNSMQEIHNQIRGLNPWPGANTYLEGKRIKLLASKITPSDEAPNKKLTPGSFCFYGDALFVQCNDGLLSITSLQPEGKKPMLPKEFANGMKKPADYYSFDGNI